MRSLRIVLGLDAGLQGTGRGPEMLARRYFENGPGPQADCGTSSWEERSG